MSRIDEAAANHPGSEAFEHDVAALANLSAYIASEARRLGMDRVARHADRAAEECRDWINQR